MSMLRTLFLKEYLLRDNYGNQDDPGVFVEIHLANSSFESNILHIMMTEKDEGDKIKVFMNLTVEEVKELMSVLDTFIEHAEN